MDSWAGAYRPERLTTTPVSPEAAEETTPHVPCGLHHQAVDQQGTAVLGPGELHAGRGVRPGDPGAVRVESEAFTARLFPLPDHARRPVGPA